MAAPRTALKLCVESKIPDFATSQAAFRLCVGLNLPDTAASRAALKLCDAFSFCAGYLISRLGRAFLSGLPKGPSSAASGTWRLAGT